MITKSDGLADEFNAAFGNEIGGTVDRGRIRLDSGSQTVACLVDAAKAEALTEVGERPAAMGLLERYL